MSSVGKLFAIMPGIGAVFGQSAKPVKTSDPVFRRVQATNGVRPESMEKRFLGVARPLHTNAPPADYVVKPKTERLPFSARAIGVLTILNHLSVFPR